MLLLMSTCTYGKEKSSLEHGSTIGINLSSGAEIKQTELSIGHAFSTHWSVNVRGSIALSDFLKGFDKEEEEHYGEFDEIIENENMKDVFYGNAGVTYWPVRAYEGAFFRVGVLFKGVSEPKLNASIGYCINIWKNIYANMSYETDITGSVKDEKWGKNRVIIGISLQFLD